VRRLSSGSRAWGFPSPDSDYDCRFVYVRPLDHYLSPWQRRDVIETPAGDELDVNGWDLAKAVRLLAGGNAVIVEWLMSTVICQAEARFREEFMGLAQRVADRHPIAGHYLHLGERFRDECLSAAGPVPRKKILYALRPAVALRWLRLHAGTLAPMQFPTLLAECDPPPALADAAQCLIARKALAGERDGEPVPEPVATFIASELEAAGEAFPRRSPAESEEARREAEAFFRATVRRLGG
jgi:predicted nucleotidyltransferase